MKIYPNPTKSTTYISVPKEMEKGGKLTVTNRDGHLVCNTQFEENQFQLIPLDFTDQPNGFYKITLENEHASVSNELLNLSDINYPVLL
jgi:hypothetical protein